MRPVTRIATLAAAALAGAALAGPAVAADKSAGAGCGVDCIETAALARTATSATVRVETTVPAAIAGSIRRQGAPLAVGNGGGPVLSHLVRKRTLVFGGLEPDTVYEIRVQATDAGGRTRIEKGTFRTRRYGCAAGCISRLAVAERTGERGRVDVVARLRTKAKVRLVVRDGATVVADATSPTAMTRFAIAPAVGHGRTLTVEAIATDDRGYVQKRVASVETRHRKAIVAFERIQIVDDGDAGPNRGDLSFAYLVDHTPAKYDGQGDLFDAFAPVGTGAVIGAPSGRSTRPGVSFLVPADGAGADVTVALSAQECDTIASQCHAYGARGDLADGVHASSSPYHYAIQATRTFDIGQLVADQAQATLPPYHGTGVKATPGHDGYLVLDALTGGNVKFRAFLTVDIVYG